MTLRLNDKWIACGINADEEVVIQAFTKSCGLSFSLLSDNVLLSLKTSSPPRNALLSPKRALSILR